MIMVIKGQSAAQLTKEAQAQIQELKYITPAQNFHWRNGDMKL